MIKEKNTNLKTLSTKFSSWYNILIFVVLIGSGIGNYMVSNYRHDEHDKDYVELDGRLKMVEGINHELLLQQLIAIQSTNKELTKKIDKTNERVDKVLEILLSK